MNGFAPIQNINNSLLNTSHASPLQLYGTNQSLERYEYERKTPSLGMNTVNTELKKRFYGNSTNRSASHIAEKKRVNQIGIYGNTLPIKQVVNNNNIANTNSALNRVRNHGCVLPKKCNNKPIGLTPNFDGRSISINPNNPGGNKWFNLTNNRWNKCCVTNNVSHYYPDYLHGRLGTSKIVKLDNNFVKHDFESNGYAKTYTDIKKRYIYQPYNPSGF